MNSLTHHRKIRASAVLTGATFLLAALLAGCASGAKESGKPASSNTPATQTQAGAAEQPKVVRIGYQKGNTLNVLKVKANLDQKLKERGIAVEWNVFPSGGTVLEALTSGKIDYGNAADGSGVFAQASGKPFVYVGNDLPNPEGMGIMVHKDSPIKTIADLKGKKVAVVKGGNHHYLTVLALEKAGLKDNDVEYVFVKDASEGRAVFETKKVDALGSWDPFFATVQIDLKPVTLTDGAGYSPNRTFYYATTEFTQKHADLVKLILEETDVADKWANQNKPEVVKLLTQELGIDEESIRTAINRRTFGVEAITKDIIAPQQQLADTFLRIGLITEKLDVSKLMPVDAPWAPNLKR
ncbi:sulfonate ABC transporter substrate-binding protein [Paenibacillus hodogayensis]|uniref:Sulfonate ABC transporter substrate-binding protein n=1 Tax=Paenibacillus hodogayensis TaxID=279208 RepID=A0ABV5VQ78_9BACL